MLVRDSLVAGKILNTSKFNSDSMQSKDELLEDEDGDKGAKDVGNWIAMLIETFDLDKEIGLVASISLTIALKTLCYSKLIMMLK